MVITNFGKAVAFCGMCTICFGMGVADKKSASFALTTKAGDVEIVENVEQFCRIVSERFGGPEALSDENDKLAEEISRYIMDNKCAVCVRDGKLYDHSGRSPLAVATQYGQLCLMQAFLLAGADVNEIDSCERTPLHRAVMVTWDSTLNVMPILEYLIKNGANPRLRSKPKENEEHGQTPAQLAHQNRFEKAARYLEQQEKLYAQGYAEEIDGAAEPLALVKRLLAGVELDDSDDE